VFAHFASELDLARIPDEVREYAKDLVLDAIGNALAAARQDYAYRALAAFSSIAQGQRGQTVIGMHASLPLRDAVMMNALLVHAMDFDDTHVQGIVHVSASLLPCVLGIGEYRGSDGASVLSAYIAGIEVASRLGIAANNQLHQIGFHPTGVCGAFGCALAAARLLGATVRQYVDAQGIVLSAAAGSLEFVSEGAWTKRLNPGFAAAAGITSAFLAREGFIGPTRPYEGRDGLFRAYLGSRIDKARISDATSGLGTVWETLGVGVKPVPACHYAHGIVDAAIALRQMPDFDASLIADVAVLVPSEVFPTLCEPWDKKLVPHSGYAAKFSLPYIASVALLRGRADVSVFSDDAVRDPEVLSLAGRVRALPDPNSQFPHGYSAEVRVTLRSGLTLVRRQDRTRGGPDHRLSRAEVQEKFMANAAMVVDRQRAQRIADVVARLDELESVAVLADLLDV
jgi:2-methylcitrate dehydratase PrpD